MDHTALLWTATLLSTVAFGACQPDADSPARSVSERDSAGIRLVDHRALPDSLENWSIASQPDVSIGAPDGTGPDVFGRVADVVETSEGVIVVADGFDMELRAFDSAGVHLWSAGHRGEGPGEFEVITAVSVIRGDSIAVFDADALRVTIFTESGVLARDYRLADPTATRPPGKNGRHDSRRSARGLGVQAVAPPRSNRTI